MSGNERWTPKGAGPWYDLGVWLVIYGAIVGGPSLAVAGLLWLANLGGIMPLGREFEMTLTAGGTAALAILVGFVLVRREREDLRRLWELERWRW